MTFLREVWSALASIPSGAWIAISFLPIPLAFAWAMWRADGGDASTFKFIHLITNDQGRGSNKELAYTMLAVVCVWAIPVQIILDRLTEWFLTGILGVFIAGALGTRWTQYKARAAAVPDAPATAGDLDAEPPAAYERHVRTDEMQRVPANPLAAGEPVKVEVANTEPIATTETPAGKAAKKVGRK